MKYNPAVMASLALVVSTLAGWAQTVTVSSNPADGATGVSPSAPVIFTFSAAVNPSTAAFFTSQTTPFFPVSSAWSAGNTVLTCTPVSPFPSNTEITWTVFGMDGGGGFVTGTGTFSTGTGGGGGGGGSGTNKITTFSAFKSYFNEQLTADAPTPDTNAAYYFSASTALASNVAATAVTVTLPTGGTPVGLTSFLHNEDYIFVDYSTNKTTFEANYPQGPYVFNVTGTPSNLQATVTLPTTMTQPNAPHVSNFPQTQAIDSSKPLTVHWDAFQGGTASDFISLAVNGDFGGVLFSTPGPGTNGALNGTATSATIPAGTLAAGSNYTAVVGFFHWLATTNTTIATVAARGTFTQFTINTVGATSTNTVPIVSNPTRTDSSFSFDVATSPNQLLKVRYSSDLALPFDQWQTLLTTNSPGTSVHVTVPLAGATGFLRLQNGP